MTVKSRSAQSGAALVVVLMLLLIITLLGLASMRGSLMQERMAGYTQGRALAFQAAEAGLRQAEITIRDGGDLDLSAAPVGSCSAGKCGRPDYSKSTEVWAEAGFWAGDKVASGKVVTSGELKITPKYIIEYFGTGKNSEVGVAVDMSKPPVSIPEQKIYRITAYASTPNGVEAMVQSLYRH